MKNNIYAKMASWQTSTLVRLVKRGSSRSKTIPREMRTMAWGILVSRGVRG